MQITHPKIGPRDVFLHLLVIIFLYMCVFSFGALLFQYSDLAFPDPLRYGYSARGAVRWPVSMLVVVFPLYVWLNAVLQVEVKKEPAKKELKTRRWLMAFTIFLTAIAIVTDLITLTYRFLSGGLTMPFVFKFLAVLVIAGSVFLYYGWLFKKDILPSEQPQMRLFVRGVISIGTVAILAGFVVAGSPFAERQRQFDERRVNDLSALQWEIVNYWQSKERLPDSLDALRDDIRGFIPPVDPEIKAPYEYNIRGPLSFQLCAIFTLSSTDEERKGVARPLMPEPYGVESWSHGVGRVCFDRTIDPDLFPPHRKAMEIR